MAITITDAVLWINHPALMLERACGLTVLERQLFTLARAGIRRVWIASTRPAQAEKLRLPEGLELQWVSREGDGPVECRPPYIGFSGDHLVRKDALQEILSKTYTEHLSFQDDDKKGVIQILPFRGDRVVQYEKQPMPAGSCIRVDLTAKRAETLAWILAGARKGHDGFMARVFDRHISLAATRWLLDTRLRPNHMTIFSSAIGIAGALQFAVPGHAHALAGAGLIWLHSVLDGCDGEMARLRFQESRFGGVLDFWGDNLVHFLLFACLGLGLFRAGAGGWAMILGVLAAVSSLVSALLTFRLTTKSKQAESGPLFKGIALEPAPEGTERTLQRIEDMLTQRDFIYILLLAAAFQKQQFFLIAAGIGTPLFFFVLLYLTAQGDARESTAAAAKTPPPALAQSSTRGSHK